MPRLRLLCFLMFIYFWERERQSVSRVSRETHTHRIRSRFQSMSCQHRAWRKARTHELWDHDLSQSWRLNWLSHPGAPKISNTILNSDGESGHPCLGHDHREKAFSFSPVRMILAIGLFLWPLWCWGIFLLSLLCWGFLSRINAPFCQMLFLHLLTGSYGSYHFFY